MSNFFSIIPVEVIVFIGLIIFLAIYISEKKQEKIYINFLNIMSKEFPNEMKVSFTIQPGQRIVIQHDVIDFYYKGELANTAKKHEIIIQDTDAIKVIVHRFDRPYRKNIEKWMKNYVSSKESVEKAEKIIKELKMKKLKENYKNELK